MNSTTPKVTVIILNWNGKQDTLQCLESVKQLKYSNFEIILVDNDSTDDSVDAISEQYSDIIILNTGKNLGYAGGNNAGIRYALKRGTDFIFLLNNDAFVSEDLLHALTTGAEKLPPKSILGAKIYFYDKPNTLWFNGGRWKKETNSFEHIGYNLLDSTEFNHQIEVDYISGCALFARAESFNDIGLLDENFFLYYEETDWCYRARARGYKCVLIPEAKVWHKASSSLGADSPQVKYFLTRNKLLWAKKHLTFSARIDLHKESIKTLVNILLPPFVWINKDLPIAKRALWCFSSWVKTVKRNIQSPLNKATLRGLLDFYLGRLGECPEYIRLLRA
ncbi:hypothetical protein EDE11_10294 [Methylomonas methanica]|nr:glycosyltransferase family 2 protein [Methylomonas methanica]TCV87593.1 hypothetical protein EDE11_10294 [Methylomonas methanica]